MKREVGKVFVYLLKRTQWIFFCTFISKFVLTISIARQFKLIRFNKGIINQTQNWTPNVLTFFFLFFILMTIIPSLKKGYKKHLI